MKAQLKKGNTRKTGKEQYYTLPSIVDFCLDQVSLNKKASYLEPAGGNGSFIKGLLARGVTPGQITSFDIEPHHRLVQRGDFLTQGLDRTDYITISNPPFGRANSLGIKFFNHAAQFSSRICFLVPKSWRKWSIHNSLDPYFHLVSDVDVAYDDGAMFFDADGYNFEGSSLNVVFQVWEKRKVPRTKVVVPNHNLIKKTTPDQANVALVVFGWSCGKVLEDFPKKQNTTLMFLKAKNKEVVQALKDCGLDRFYKNVAYTYALGINEINYCLNEQMGLGNGQTTESP